MTTFAQATLNPAMTVTENGAAAYTKTGSKMLDLFGAIGSSRTNPNIVQMFMAAYAENPDLAMKCLFWARDARGGCGERKVFRDIMQALQHVAGASVLKNVKNIPVFGRFDDLTESFDSTTHSYKAAIALYARILLGEAEQGRTNSLAAKWADRKGPHAVALTKALNMTPKQYRKFVVGLSNTVEQHLCAKQFDQINYEHVPSIAAGRYAKAFARNDEIRYNEYKAALEKGEVKINASVAFPYQVIRTLRSDPVIGQAQWAALPDYMNGKRVLPMVDVSGSMSCSAGGNVTCMDVAVSLGLYCSDKNKGSFKDLFLTFSERPELQKLEGNLTLKLAQLSQSDWAMNTNIEAAFKLILNTALRNDVPQEEMPETLLILSDMQIDQCAKDPSATLLEMLAMRYADAGYKLPGVVFWCLNAQYANVPTTKSEVGTVLVSGFSPAILKAVLSADFDRITPENLMLDVLLSERYKDVVA